MFKSKIEVTGLKAAQDFIEGVNKKLINPAPEVQETKAYLLRKVKQRIRERKNPAGGYWAARKPPTGSWPLLRKSGALYNSHEADISVKNGNIEIDIFATGNAAKYAAVHNNGMRIRNRAGRFTKMKKRQYAWLKAAEKQEIARDIWANGFV